MAQYVERCIALIPTPGNSWCLGSEETFVKKPAHLCLTRNLPCYSTQHVFLGDIYRHAELCVLQRSSVFLPCPRAEGPMEMSRDRHKAVILKSFTFLGQLGVILPSTITRLSSTYKNAHMLYSKLLAPLTLQTAVIGSVHFIASWRWRPRLLVFSCQLVPMSSQ